MTDCKYYIYDLETFPNFFSGVFYNISTEETSSFVIYSNPNNPDDYINQYSELLEFLDQCEALIGFNNINFDYPVLHSMMKNRKRLSSLSTDELNKYIKEKANSIIESKYSAINEKYVKIKQLDLYRLHHFDNRAKSCSLKWCEFAMRWEKLQDLPYKHDHIIQKNEVKNVLEYNVNDVMATYELYQASIPKIKLRKGLRKKYGLDFTNVNDSSMGVMIFEKLLLKARPDLKRSELVNMRTYRDEIKIEDCVFDYVSFKNEGFQKLLEYLKTKTITSTKGFFTGIPINDCRELIPYFNLNSISKGKVDKLHIRFKGLDYVYGVGGLHASIDPGIYKADDEYEIIDIDVASYYPNLSIKNRIFPEHLGEMFCDIYEGIYNDRKKAKKLRDKITDAGLKLLLNSAYGKSNSEYSWLYDPLFTMKITMNGQLLMTMLSEELSDISQILQANTDGVTVRIHKSKKDELYRICKEWEKLTKLELEYADYQMMCISNVNNYLAMDTDGNIKYKGHFEIDKKMKGELQYHKDHGMRIVPIAIKRYLVNDIPVEETIKNYLNQDNSKIDDVEYHGIYDFCLGIRAKGGKKGRPQMLTRYIDENGKLIENVEQKINRFYISKKGKHFLKKYNDGSEAKIVSSPQKGKPYNITMFNDYVKQNSYDINYNYYIREANKIINNLVSNQQTLF